MTAMSEISTTLTPGWFRRMKKSSIPPVDEGERAKSRQRPASPATLAECRHPGSMARAMTQIVATPAPANRTEDHEAEAPAGRDVADPEAVLREFPYGFGNDSAPRAA